MVIVLNLSWPAVSHICSFTLFPSSSIVLILKSMPIVVIKEGVKESSLNRRRQHDLPTPESPIKRSLICYLSVEQFPEIAGSVEKEPELTRKS